MDPAEKNPDTQAAVEVKALLLRTFSGARVPRDTRERLATLVETALSENIGVLRRYVLALSHGGRAAEMMKMYADGMTLDEIGSHYGVTRERIRQVLTTTFGDYRSVRPDELRYERAIRQRAEALAEWDERFGAEIERRFALNESDVTISKALGAGERKVANYRTRHGLRRTRGLDWTDEVIFDCLKKAEKAYPGDLTIASYSRWRDSVGPEEAPSYLTLLTRFDSFENACVAAGVEHGGRSNAQRRKDYIGAEEAQGHLLNFVEWCEAESLRPTSGSFSTYRESHKAPSLAIMSRRLDGFRQALDALLASRTF
jgi:hypothetical protein